MGAADDDKNDTVTVGKQKYEGKEYDYVFNVDIEDGTPPLKLPYNLSEDPWHAAQAFIYKNNLPQVYLEKIANFIITNSNQNNATFSNSESSIYQDPFTGGTRYQPSASDTNNSTNNFSPTIDASNLISFKNCDASKIFEKLM